MTREGHHKLDHQRAKKFKKEKQMVREVLKD